MNRRTRLFKQRVFINIPFDKSYERSFVALISALLAIGRIPRSVLCMSESGQGRLERIQSHLESCRVSIHDLSRTGLPARFNMPFELGLACNLARYRKPHSYIIFEKKKHRLNITLSDIRGRDEKIHNGSMISMIHGVYDVLASESGNPEILEVHKMAIELWKYATQLKKELNLENLYSRYTFLLLVSAGTQLAQRRGFIN